MASRPIASQLVASGRLSQPALQSLCALALFITSLFACFMCSCGSGPPKAVAIDEGGQTASDSVGVDIFIDATGSMKGFTVEARSNSYVPLLDALKASVLGGWKEGAV